MNNSNHLFLTVFVVCGVAACSTSSGDGASRSTSDTLSRAEESPSPTADAGADAAPREPFPPSPFPLWNWCRRDTRDANPTLEQARSECVSTCNRDYVAAMDAARACQDARTASIAPCLENLPQECRLVGEGTPPPAHCVPLRQACDDAIPACPPFTAPEPDCNYCFNEIDSAGNCSPYPD